MKFELEAHLLATFVLITGSSATDPRHMKIYQIALHKNSINENHAVQTTRGFVLSSKALRVLPAEARLTV